MGQDFAERRFVSRSTRFVRNGFTAGRVLDLGIRLVHFRNFRRQLHPVFVRDKLHEFGWHLRHGQDPIHHPGADRRYWHAVVLGLARVLRHGHPALSAHVFQTNYAV